MMKVIIAGDFAPRSRLAEQIKEKKFGDIFSDDLRTLIKSADFSFVNFESPVIENEYKPIPKCGPNLHCTSEAVEAVMYAGFTGVTMANNHILDYGVKGLNKSIISCKSSGIDIVGVGENLLAAEKILYLKKENKTLAIINCCEHEFSIATDKSPGANPLDPVRQFYTIKEARLQADYVLVIVHGGHEHYQLPSLRMQEIYRFFIDIGADAVINHHQHCFSGYEMHKGKPIFYGIGNFCFDGDYSVKTNWNEGFLVELILNDSISFNIHPYIQCYKEPNIVLLTDSSFDQRLSELNKIISDRTLLLESNRAYFQTLKQVKIKILGEYNIKILKLLQRIRVLPSLLNSKKALSVLNSIECESHRDVIIEILKNVFCK